MSNVDSDTQQMYVLLFDPSTVGGKDDASGWWYIPPSPEGPYTAAYCEEMEELGWGEKLVFWAGDLEELQAYIEDSGNEDAIYRWRLVLWGLGKGTHPDEKRWRENGHQIAAEAAFPQGDSDYGRW